MATEWLRRRKRKRTKEEKEKEDELKEIIRKKRGGNWIEYHGPYRIGTADVWEIWTWINENEEDKDDWTPQTRFWLEEKKGSKLYFSYFSDLAPHLHNRFESAARQGADFDLAKERQAEELYRKKFSLWVASAGFLIAVLTTCGLALSGNTSMAVLLAVTGVVSSGRYMLFGGWRLPHPKLGPAGGD
jgi:hypothetical protein